MLIFSEKLHTITLFCDENMPNVSFYILESNNINSLFKTATQLTIKAYNADNQVLIYSNHSNILAQLNELLWTFSPSSFIPHSLVQSEEDVDSIDPIVLANFEPQHLKKDLLIQLSDHVPENFQQYQRIIEILYSDEDYLTKGRERFKFYRRHGIEPKTIKI